MLVRGPQLRRRDCGSSRATCAHTFFTAPKVLAETNPHLPDVVDLRIEEGKVSGLKLFHTTESGMTEVTPRLAEVEADVQGLVDAHMETLLGVRFRPLS